MIDKFSLIAVYPEIVLLLMTCVIALVDLLDQDARRTAAYLLSALTLLIVAFLTCRYALGGDTIYGFGGMAVSDPMGNWLKCFASLATLVMMVYGRPYVSQRGMLRGGEWFVLNLLALLGAFVMISGSNFLILYLGLELLTLASYALVALRRDHALSLEAAMKYFVLGAIASGFLLYGLSMIYGATGTLDLDVVSKAVYSGRFDHQVLTLGLVFVVAAVAFKFGVVPFHMWVPDVYQGAPTAVTLMIGAAPKLAAFALAMRLLADGLQPLAADWQQMLALLAIASLLLGNLAAIAQTNLKRMLAYSTIAQMGFVLLGLLCGVVDGNPVHAANAYSSAMFYVVTYVLTTLGSFGVILLLSREGFESEEISDLAGLNQRSPLYAGIMAVCMLSLTGLPPLVGFQAKLSIIQALVNAAQPLAGVGASTGQPLLIALAVFAVLMSLIGAFYYIRVIKVMYFDAPVEQTQPIAAPLEVRALLSLNGLAVLLLGILPGALFTLCADAIRKMLAT